MVNLCYTGTNGLCTIMFTDSLWGNINYSEVWCSTFHSILKYFSQKYPLVFVIFHFIKENSSSRFTKVKKTQVGPAQMLEG